MMPERSPESLQANVEVLFELYRGPHGAVHLGRMLKGIETGRLVTLREVRDIDPAVRAALDVARSVAHPQLLKPLGLVTTGVTRFLASEYVPGTSLLELGASVRESRFPLRPGVAVRIIKDALRAAEAAQRVLSDAAALGYARCLFADTVWIAEFGDVLLTDVNVAPLLTKNPDLDPAKARAKDLLSAAIELFQLASGEALSEEVTSKLGAYVPAALADVIEQAFGLQGKTPFSTLDDLIRALNELPKDLQADELEVSEELKRRLGTVLTQRKHKLSLLELGAAAKQESDADDVTRVFQAGALPELLNPTTVRPDGAAEDAVNVSVPKAPKPLPEWHDEPTRIGVINATGDALRSDRPKAPEIAELEPTEEAAEPESEPPLASEAPPHQTRGVPRSFWVVALALLATLSAVWWARSTDTHTPHTTDPARTR